MAYQDKKKKKSIREMKMPKSEDDMMLEEEDFGEEEDELMSEEDDMMPDSEEVMGDEGEGDEELSMYSDEELIEEMRKRGLTEEDEEEADEPEQVSGSF